MPRFSDDRPEVRASTSPSRAQVRANRRNAKRSTGPRTVEGKARSSLNAATHGMFCKSPVLPGERDREYIAFRNLLLDSPGLRPQDWLELSLADQFVLAKWRIRRLGDVEAMTHQSIADDLAEVVAMRREDLGRVLEQREAYLAMRGANDRVEDLDEEDEEHEHEDDEDADDEEQRLLRETFVRMHQELRVPASVTMMTSFITKGDHDGAFERIDRLRHRLELSAHRALRELRQLRKDLGVDVSKLETCPFLEELPDEDDQELDVDPQGGDVVAEMTTSGSPEDLSGLSSRQPLRNEPNPPKDRAGDAPEGTCDEDSRRIELFVPTKFAPPRAGEASADRTEAGDQR